MKSKLDPNSDFIFWKTGSWAAPAARRTKLSLAALPLLPLPALAPPAPPPPLPLEMFSMPMPKVETSFFMKLSVCGVMVASWAVIQ